MRRHLASFLFPACLALSACASLDVRVDVLDPVYLHEQSEVAMLQADAARLLKGDVGQEQELSETMRAEYMKARRDGYGKILTYLDERPRIEGEVASTLDQNRSVIASRQADSAKFLPLQQRFASEISAADLNVVSAMSRPPAQTPMPPRRGNAATPPSPPIDGELRAALVARRQVMAGFAAAVRGQIAALDAEISTFIDALQQAYRLHLLRVQTVEGSKGAQEVAAAATAAKAEGQASVAGEEARKDVGKTIAAASSEAGAEAHSIIDGGVSLANNPIAFAAISPGSDPHWARLYNRALGRGVFGGTDIAIKLNGAADFSVKGFVFDGRSTAQMVSKVASRSLTLIAAAAGAPFATSQGSDETPSRTSFDATKAIGDATGALARTRAEDDAYRASLFRMADTILLTVDDGKNPTAADRETIRATFASRIAPLAAVSGQTSPP